MTRFMKPVWVKLFVLLFGLLATAQSASASTFTAITDDDLIISARAIVTGKVLSIESNYDAQQDRIYTYVTVKVQQVLKGQITERRIVLKELGGQVGNRGLIVWGNPQFKRDERVLIYLDTWKDGSLRTYQLFLGKFNIVKDEATGHEYVQRGESDESTSLLRPQTIGQPGRTYTDRMELNSYLRMVSERLATNQTRSDQFQQTYYGGVPLNARPAEYSKVAGHGDILPEWTYISSAHPRWFEPDSGQPVVFQVNPDQAPNPQIMDDVAAAMNAWGSVPGTSLRITTGGTTSNCREGVGSNLILFNACDGRWAPSSGWSGTLALGGLGWTGNSTVIGGIAYLQATAGFISFNPYASCWFNDHCNVREITTHELGHAMGLGHSADTTATMYAFAHFDGRCAGLMADDKAGITTIYPGSGGGGGGSPLSVTTTSLPNGTVGTLYTATLQASGGTLPYSWSVTSGALPAGLSLNAATGVITGTPTTAATANFTVQVQDSASATATKALSIVVNSSGGGGGGGTFSSQFVSQNVPTTLTPGQTFVANLVWTNTGTSVWDGSLGGLRLISQNPANNTTWGGNTVLLTPFVVLPGQQLNVSFQAIAPSTAGTYNFQWILASDAVTTFGQPSTNVVIQVGSGGGGGGGGSTNNAAFVSQTVPGTMTAGQSVPVSLTFTNTGTTTWTPGSYVLTSMNPTGNIVWGFNQVALSSSVAPGANITFNFSVTAPTSTGTYNFQWGMAQSGVGTFGSPSTNVAVTVTGGQTSGNNAQFMSQSVPANWTPGQTYTVSVTMKNTGTTTWGTTTYKLGSQSPANNNSWGPSRATLPKNVPPGSLGTFTFVVTAPSAAGTFNFQWEMIQEGGSFFGDMTPNKPLVNGGSGATDGASFVSQTVPGTMTAGQSVPVSLTFTNTGTTTWTPGTYTLGSRNPDGNTTWGLSQVALSSSVAPGASATFSFNVTAPATAGSYSFQWGMRQGTTYFGASSTATSVNVTAAGGGGTNNAQFISQNVPATLNTGQATSVTVTMRNNGTTTWAAGTYSLQSQAGTTWGVSRVNVASPVAPGSNGVFTFTITAPATAGTYNSQWRMVQDNVGAFGDLTPNVAVVVSSPGGGVAPLVLVTASLPYGVRGVAYNQQLVATGGRQPYTWSYTGSLPAGVTLNSSTGVISGTPTTGGSYTLTVTVRDADGRTASKTYKTFFQ